MTLNYKERVAAQRQARVEAKEARESRKLNYFRADRSDDGSKMDTVIRVLVPKSGDIFFKAEDCRELAELVNRRQLIEPEGTYGEDNPLSEFLGELKAADWDTFKEYRPSTKYYGFVLRRDDEEKKPQLWQMSYKQYMAMESLILDDENWCDEDLFDEEAGFDMVVSTTPTDKVYKNERTGKSYPVFDTSFTPSRKRQGPILTKGRGKTVTADTEGIEKLIDSIPEWTTVFPRLANETLAEIVQKLRSDLLDADGDGVEVGAQAPAEDTGTSNSSNDDDDDGFDAAAEFKKLVGKS